MNTVDSKSKQTKKKVGMAIGLILAAFLGGTTLPGSLRLR